MAWPRAECWRMLMLGKELGLHNPSWSPGIRVLTLESENPVTLCACA